MAKSLHNVLIVKRVQMYIKTTIFKLTDFPLIYFNYEFNVKL